MKSSMITAAILLGCCLGACSSAPGVYFDIGAGYKLEDGTSAVLRPSCDRATGVTSQPRSCGGRNPTAHIALGFEFRDGSYCELQHWSHYRDNSRNGRTETHKDELMCSKRWGGRN